MPTLVTRQMSNLMIVINVAMSRVMITDVKVSAVAIVVKTALKMIAVTMIAVTMMPLMSKHVASVNRIASVAHVGRSSVMRP